MENDKHICLSTKRYMRAIFSKMVSGCGRYLGIKPALEVYSVFDRRRILMFSPRAGQIVRAESDAKELIKVIPDISGGFLK